MAIDEEALLLKQRELEEKEKQLEEKEKNIRGIEAKILTMKHGLYDKIDVSLKTRDKIIFAIVAALIVALAAAFIYR